MRNKIKKLLTGIIIVSLIASISIASLSLRGFSTSIDDSSFSVSNLSTQDTIWPPNSSDWTEVAPETQGLDSDKIAEMFSYIQSLKNYDLHSVIIVRNGYLLVEEYLYNYEVLDTKEYSDQLPPKSYSGPIYHDQASTTKSLISILIGIALQKGLLDNLNQTLYEFFGHIWNESTFVDSALKKNITIEQLLTMNSGLIGDWAHDWPPADCINLALEHVPLGYTPGDPGEWEYTDFGPNLLSGIITNVTGGESAGEFAKDNLFTPLGISEEEYNWKHDSLNISYGGYEFECSPKVQAKLGMLCLNNGTWNGTQIIDNDYIKNATSSQVSGDKAAGYGYLWYTNGPHGGYNSFGAGGQCIYVIPEYNITIGFTGAHSLGYDSLIVDYIVQFAKDNPPKWDRIPGSKTIYEGDSFYYDVNASDTSGVDYSIDDTVNFDITSEGIITNARSLSAGDYPLEISAYNPFNNSVTTGINIRVLSRNGTPSNGIPGFDFNILFLTIFCISALLIIRRKKYSKK